MHPKPNIPVTNWLKGQTVLKLSILKYLSIVYDTIMISMEANQLLKYFKLIKILIQFNFSCDTFRLQIWNPLNYFSWLNNSQTRIGMIQWNSLCAFTRFELCKILISKYVISWYAFCTFKISRSSSFDAPKTVCHHEQCHVWIKHDTTLYIVL